MSKKIVILSEEIVNKIAAGEVVERPASIVKELLENAIDAGATDIRVELEKGGTQSIRVIDNGSGIAREDVPLAFQRYATSKIHKFEDISSVSSFGFRGEAMPSIASVAKVELLTRRKNDLEGTKAVLEAGKIKEITPEGCPAGTQISVTRIFANVPARRKFLRTEATEQGLCMDAVTRLALAHPEISFKVNMNERDAFTAPRVKDSSERIAMVIGEDFSQHCISIDAQKENLSLTGFVSRPEFTKSNSKSVFLFVNKRFIRDNSLTHAVLSAYRQVIEPRRYPAAVLFIDLPPEDIDVNVHPAKLEVRFKDSHGIYELVSRTISKSLAEAEMSHTNYIYRLSPKTDLLSRRKGKKESVPDFTLPRERMSARPFGLFSRQNLQQAIDDDLLKHPIAEKKPETYGIDKIPVKGNINFADLEYLGQFANTYLVFVGIDGLVLLDQHAAHERIILEKLKKSTEKKVVSQSLLILEIVTLTTGQIALFSECIDFLREIGLEIEIFGKDALAVKAVPATLSHIKISEMISDIADQLGELNQKPSLQEKKDKILASLACRAAIKANRSLSYDEVEALCHELEATPFNLTCPHGRPITINFSLNEIERMFKRK